MHGLTAADLADAPTWPQVNARLAAITATRKVLAYNAPFDRDRVLHDCRRTGIDPAHLFDPARWHCVMARPCQALRLGGRHRALVDVCSAREQHQLIAVATRKTVHYLSKRQFAQRIGASDPTLSGYKLPPPDVTIGPVKEDGSHERGSVGGWTEETIDEWQANRPGHGARTDLKDRSR